MVLPTELPERDQGDHKDDQCGVSEASGNSEDFREESQTLLTIKRKPANFTTDRGKAEQNLRSIRCMFDSGLNKSYF